MNFSRRTLLAIAIALTLAPFLGSAWHEVGERLLSNSDAAQYLRDGGSIQTSLLEAYRSTLVTLTVIGLLSSAVIGWLLAKFFVSADTES